jgi:plasmid stabilization system protein ParE
MTYRVLIQPPARADIEAAYLYIREADTTAADRWLGRMEEAVRSLRQLPARCAVAPESREFEDEIRQLLVGRGGSTYRVLFVIRGREVRVLHVRHGARRPIRRGEI